MTYQLWTPRVSRAEPPTALARTHPVMVETGATCPPDSPVRDETRPAVLRSRTALPGLPAEFVSDLPCWPRWTAAGTARDHTRPVNARTRSRNEVGFSMIRAG